MNPLVDAYQRYVASMGTSAAQESKRTLKGAADQPQSMAQANDSMERSEPRSPVDEDFVTRAFRSR